VLKERIEIATRLSHRGRIAGDDLGVDTAKMDTAKILRLASRCGLNSECDVDRAVIRVA